MSDILKRYATENFFDRTWPNFMELLERGAFSHTAFPGWMLIRSKCVTCNDDVTVIKYHGERYELVPSGDEQMGKRWVIHQCAQPQRDGEADDYGFVPDYGEADDIAEAQQEAKDEIWPDDPEVRDGDGEIRSGGFGDELREYDD
jgi:hypothetical protein